jgi:segregation and condensation protein A
MTNPFQQSPISHQDQDYLVTTELYKGPLDLLLQLIEKSELDITKFALSEITDQYLKYLNHLLTISSYDVSEFIVIASKLIQIKSEVLLPRTSIREPGEEDPGEALAQQLREYKRFKEISTILANRQIYHLKNYSRLAPLPIINKEFGISNINLQDIIHAAQIVFSKIVEISTIDTIVKSHRVTIKEKINLIKEFLFHNQKGTFRTLLPKNPLRIEIVVTFLALLELVKLQLIFTQQNTIFDEIEFEKSPDWINLTEIELEFGE